MDLVDALMDTVRQGLKEVSEQLEAIGKEAKKSNSKTSAAGPTKTKKKPSTKKSASSAEDRGKLSKLIIFSLIFLKFHFFL